MHDLNSNRFYSYLNSAKQLISAYDGRQPFSIFLKAFFKERPKYGSKDRKIISSLCYSYFRIGKLLSGCDVEERILAALFLCSNSDNALLEFLKPDWNAFLREGTFPSKDLKIGFMRSVYPQLREDDIFPFAAHLSEGIDRIEFIFSHFQQPDLFIRVRPGYENKVLNTLAELHLSFEYIEPFTIRLPNNTNLATVGMIDREIVVQDLSSQRAGAFVKMAMQTYRPGEKVDGATGTQTLKSGIKSEATILKVWDCCAASGGKSLMAYDLLPHVALTVSDMRTSIIKNLADRFSRAGISDYRSLVLDLSETDLSSPGFTSISNDSFDLIIVDAPCSGSGTWSRTPEYLYYFKAEEIHHYSSLQKEIIMKVMPFLRPGGKLLYITCSVFQMENEEIVEFIQKNAAIELQHAGVIKGYDTRADTMFAALFTN